MIQIRDDVLGTFPELFGRKRVNGREVDVERTIEELTRELRPEIAAALRARRELLESPAAVSRKYAWPRWNDRFEDPAGGEPWTFRQIVQGMIDNFLGRDGPRRLRRAGKHEHHPQLRALPLYVCRPDPGAGRAGGTGRDARPRRTDGGDSARRARIRHDGDCDCPRMCAGQ